MGIARTSTFAHTGNPTTAPTAALPATEKDDVLVLVVANGGSNANPTLSGTSVTVGGLAWTRKISGVGPIEANAFNGSLWWARAKGDHAGQTVIAATVDSGSLVGASYRGVISTGDPFRFALTENNDSAPITSIDGLLSTLLAADMLTFCVAVDDNSTAPTDRILLMVGGEVVSEGEVAVYATSEGGNDTGAAFWDYQVESTDSLESGEAETLEPASRSTPIFADLIPQPKEGEGGKVDSWMLLGLGA